MNIHERPRSTVSVGLILTNGRSNRLFLTQQNPTENETAKIGLIAGGVELSDPHAVAAGMREAVEEAGIKQKNIIFAKGRNDPHPHVALINKGDRLKVGLIFDMTYSGPQVPIDGWDIEGDQEVSRVLLYSWRQVLELLEKPEQVYQSEFNIPQLIRWQLFNYGGKEKRTTTVNDWLHAHKDDFPGLIEKSYTRTNRSQLKLLWEYVPPYESWILMPGIFGLVRDTNFARERSIWQQPGR